MKNHLHLFTWFCLFGLFPATTQGQTVVLQEDQKTSFYFLLKTGAIGDYSSTGHLNVELLYTTGESGDPVLKLTIRPEVADNQRIFAFDKERTFPDIMRNLRDHNFSADRRFPRDLLPFYSTENNILQLKEDFTVGFAAFRNPRTFEFTFSDDLESDDGRTTIDLILQFYYSENDQLQNKLDPLFLRVNVPAPFTERETAIGAIDRQQDDEIPEARQRYCQKLLEESQQSFLEIRDSLSYFEPSANIQRFSWQANQMEAKTTRIASKEDMDALTFESRDLSERITRFQNLLGRKKIRLKNLRDDLSKEPAFCQTEDLENRISLQINALNDLEASLAPVKNKVTGIQNSLIGDFMALSDSINKLFAPSIKLLGEQLMVLEARVVQLKTRFEKTRNSPYYFTWQQRSYKNSIAAKNDSLKQLQLSFAETTDRAADAFSGAMGLNEPFFSDITRNHILEFNERYQQVKNETAKLSEELVLYEPRPFPWLLATILAMVAGVLLFGIAMLLKALFRKKKTREVPAEEYHQSVYTENEPDWSSDFHAGQQQDPDTETLKNQSRNTPQNRLKI